MLFELKQFARNHIIYLFMAPKSDISEQVCGEYICDEAKYIINSSIVTKCKVGGEVKYFRECRTHKKFKEYFADAIDDYFQNIDSHPNKVEAEEAVRKDIAVKSNYKKLCRVISVFNRHLMEILAGAYSNYDAVGLPSFKGLDRQEEFIAFITYMSCIIISYKANAYVKNGMCENGSAYKQLATYELAKLLGLSELITPLCVCRLRVSGKERVGTLMDSANGSTPAYILPEDRKKFDKATFPKQLTNLEYLDAICYQLDHRLDNYNVVAKDGIIVGVEAFDNDANRTFFPRSNFPVSTYAGASCVLTGEGKINRPYMDAELAEKILGLDKEKLSAVLGKYLSNAQLKALIGRIEKLKAAIKLATAEKESFLVRDWDSAELERELDDKYGKTYFNLYINDTLMLDRVIEFEKIRQNKEK